MMSAETASRARSSCAEGAAARNGCRKPLPDLRAGVARAMQGNAAMSMRRERCWVLGFDAGDVVGSWPDARIAEAIDTLWRDAGGPACAQAWWMPCSDQYAFRWYINGQLARMLDEADVPWREFVIGQGVVPGEARPYLKHEAVSDLAATAPLIQVSVSVLSNTR
jgi:hypothetical protein